MDGIERKKKSTTGLNKEDRNNRDTLKLELTPYSNHWRDIKSIVFLFIYSVTLKREHYNEYIVTKLTPDPIPTIKTHQWLRLNQNITT